MNQQEIHSIVTTQRRFFFSGKTQSVDTRIAALKNLQCAIQKYEPEINAALRRDLGKSPFESYMCEVGLTLSEISYMLRHIRSFAKEKLYARHWRNLHPAVSGNHPRMVLH